MKASSLARAFAASLVVGVCAAQALAQKPCQPPAAGPHGPSIFTPRQEMELGEAVAEHVQRNFRAIEEEEVTAFLRRVGERLVAQLPTPEMR